MLLYVSYFHRSDFFTHVGDTGTGRNLQPDYVRVQQNQNQVPTSLQKECGKSDSTACILSCDHGRSESLYYSTQGIAQQKNTIP